jgi:hypothetical protein
MEAQPMYRACANPHTPRLGIGQALVKPIGSTQTIITNFKFTRLDVDRDNLAQMVWLNLKPDLGFIESIPALGELFFAISGLSNCHGLGLTATASAHSNVGIGAIGLETQSIVLTRNQRDFGKIEGLLIEDWTIVG